VFLSCSNVDPHIPLERVRDTPLSLPQFAGNVLYPLFMLLFASSRMARKSTVCV
jgi:hypothetical protein